LRNGVEGPDLLAAVRVEGPDVTGRIILIDETVADAVAENDQVLVNDRRRRIRVVFLVDLPHQPLADVDRAGIAEARDRLPGGGIERDQAISGIEENAQPAVLRIAPRRDAAVDVPGAVRRLAIFVGLRVERPQLR